jgi:hypothetical protein
MPTSTATTGHFSTFYWLLVISWSMTSYTEEIFQVLGSIFTKYDGILIRFKP